MDRSRRAPFVAVTLLLPGPALAAGLDGRSLGFAWAMPFLGLLLSVAILPHLAHRFWDRRMGALSAAWGLAALAPLAVVAGFAPTATAAVHVALAEYLPFLILLFALYTIAGGLVVAGNLHGSPALNTGLLALGTVLASLVGTTGASMVLIRPVLRANDGRRHNVHVVVFFIFLVSNIGGSLTPLGDPPLFLGFLRGISFFWTTRELAAETGFTVAVLLGLFYLLDRWFSARDKTPPPVPDPTPETRIRLRGQVNVVLLGALIGTIVLTSAWHPGIALTVAGTAIEGQNLVRDAVILALALMSIALTSRPDRIANRFAWRPIVEVAKIFAGIFACLVPVAAALAAGPEGAFAPLIALLTRPDGTPHDVAIFWVTGLMSSLLDNAPTYLVMFDLVGGDPARLMGPLAGTLAAISTGAVFMGALTYIGNAPNYMVYAIAREGGVPMPGFAGYLVWSGAILLPLFAVLSLVFIR